MNARMFSIFRMVLGGYLTLHFAMLIPYAAELFSTQGLLPDAMLNPAGALFPSPLMLELSPAAVTGFIWVMTGLSVLFSFGLRRPFVAAFLWFGWTALFHRNNLIVNPSLAYVGLLLALCVIIPDGEPWSLSSRRSKSKPWQMPVWVMRCAWILMAVGYTFSGITKLGSASWMDGSAMHYLLHNPLARPGWMRDFMLSLPDFFLLILTWGTVVIEVLFVPLACWKHSRPWIWLAMVLLHFGIITVVDFADLSLGMLMIHLFTFDPKWAARLYHSIKPGMNHFSRADKITFPPARGTSRAQGA